ncbi:MAG: hypothetical protein H8E44_23245 [Planctomycetes bacterium]|nr:hypothetical protein [Planctomycetota bacterium]MBL7037262.1 hypothetical protein [Pirellulaceae bacterium]
MRSVLCCCVLSTAFATLANGQDAANASPALLRWKLGEGDQLRLKVIQTTKTETKVNDKPTAMSIDTGMEMLWRVDGVEEGGTMRMTQSFTRFMMKTATPDGQTVIHDSLSKEKPSPETQDFARDIGPLLRVRFAVVMSDRGEIADVALTPEAESLLADLPDASKWKSLLTKEGMSRTLRQSLGLLPETPVAVGDAWSNNHELDSPVGKIRLANSYTYESTISRDGKSFEKLAVVTRVEPQNETKPLEGPAIPIPREYGGVFYFDTVAGRLVHSRITQTTVSKVPYRDMTIQVTASSSILMNVTPVNGN